MSKILVVSTYPIKNPQHGGQKRTAAIVEAYKQVFSEVRSSAVYYKGFYRHSGINDISLGPASSQAILASPLTGDIVCGEAIYSDPKVKKKMTKLLKGFSPDVIHIEQPFPYLGLQPLLQELGERPKIIFGSQNIEAPMKLEMLGGDTSDKGTKEVVDKIGKLEKNLSEQADLVVACTQHDLTAHVKMGATKTVLAPNGISPLTSSKGAVESWKKKFDGAGINKKVLFIGSAHPPNWAGFFAMVSKALGFVPFDARIVLAGSICDYFDKEIKPKASVEEATFWLRAYSAGRLSEDSLRGLISVADVIILPITEGGGSNLKTAEAITANKKVVTTSHGLRSFEWFRDFPNVWVADKQVDFQASITEAIEAKTKPRSHAQKIQAEDVLWQSCLSKLLKEVQKI